MSNDTNSGGGQPEPAQKLLYHATGKLYRYLAKFAGEDPDEVERAYHDSFDSMTAGADPVLIGDAINGGIKLGFSLAERRRALRAYHDELVRRELAPPAYDMERLEDEDGELTGVRVLVSEPQCEFFTSIGDEPELLIQTADGGEVRVPLEYEPGRVEPVETGETVSEVIVRPIDTAPPSGFDKNPGSADETVLPDHSKGHDEDHDAVESEYLEVAREVVQEDPGRALRAAEKTGSDTGRLVSKLLERKPSIPVEEAPDIIHEAIRRVGLDALEMRYDGLIASQQTDDRPAVEPEDATGPVGREDVDEAPPEIEGESDA